MFTSLLKLADKCDTVNEFLAEVHNLPIEGPDAEMSEAKQWLSIALDVLEAE